MINFFSEYWVEVLFSLITAGSLWLCKNIYSKMKNYKKLLEKQDQSELTNIIKKELQPIINDIKKLQNDLNIVNEKYEFHLNSIVKSYKFRLIQLCKLYLEQNFMTAEQYEQLSEFYKLYKELGGNGQAEEYYHKAITLPIKEH